MEKRKITLTTIAKQANLSIASVSRVLKNPHLTSWATQSRVHKAIHSLNVDTHYRVNPYHTFTNSKKILIVDNQLISQSLINYGLEKKLKSSGYRLFYFRFPYHQKNVIDLLISYVSQNIFDGIIVINDAPYLKKLNEYAYALPPIMLVNHFSLDFPCVYFDHVMIAHQLTKYLLSKAHKRIAILLSHHNKMSSTHLLQGYQQTLHRSNIKVDPNYIIRNCFTYEHGQLAIRCLMSSSRPPTAIICTDNSCLNYTDEKYLSAQHYQSPYNMVLGALHQSNEIKINQSKSLHLAYISQDTQPQHNELDMLSSVCKPLYKMGDQAAYLLCQLLQKNPPKIPMSHLIESESIFY